MTVQSLLNDLFSEFSDSTKQPQRDSHEVRPDDVHQSSDPERIQDHHRRKLSDRKPVKQIDGGMEGRNQDAQAATDSACSARKAGAVDGDLSRIREWCVRIGETDEEVIAEVLEKCHTDPEALRYYLSRATETEPHIPPRLSGTPAQPSIDVGCRPVADRSAANPDSAAGKWEKPAFRVIPNKHDEGVF